MRSTVLSLFLLAACNAPQDAGTACDEIQTACTPHAGRGNFGDECLTVARPLAEPACRKQLADCKAFCNLDDAPAVIANYGKIVEASYAKAVEEAEKLHDAIDAMVANPTTSTYADAQQQWKVARVPYAQTEAFRFYDGPIDNAETGPEGRLNAWPLDEAYIDYIASDASAGIINKPAEYPTLTEETLAGANEVGGETNIATGYHAIEFLLWGQDTSTFGPGQRAHTDYLTGAGASAANGARRAEYLTTVAHLLVDDLKSVRDAWAETADYRLAFVKDDSRASLRKMLTGMGSLTKGELRGERINVAYESKDQEDEHSCFSDTTLDDYINDAKGIQNVYLGRFGTIDGPGIDELVRARNAELDTKMQARLTASIAALEAVKAEGPFDQMILGADTTPGRQKIAAAMAALLAQAETIQEVAAVLGIGQVDDSAGVMP